jgi:hypothetical protein
MVKQISSLQFCIILYTGHKKENIFHELNLGLQWPVVQILFGKRRNEFVLNFDHELREIAYCSGMRKEEISVPVIKQNFFCEA